MTTSIIAYDFNGVMDIKNSHEVRDESLSFRVRKQVNLENAKALLSLAIETNTPLVCISMLEQYTSVTRQLLAALLHSDVPEYVEFAKTNKMALRQLMKRSPFPGKKQEVINALNEEGYKMIALEDEVVLTNCEFFMIQNRDILSRMDEIKSKL